ncbi:MAG: hypothetical protein RL240_246 [Planctomycetota bacterium]|jgi:chromosome segregation ATPase
MKNLFAIALLLILYVGCDARSQVLKDNVVAKIDKMLGEFQVRQKEAEMALSKLESGMEQLKRARIETKIKLAQLTEKQNAAEAKIGEVDKTIGRLRDYLSQEGDVEISGKKFSQAQVKEMADKMLSTRKKLVAEAETFEKSSKQVERSLTLLERNETNGKAKLDNVKLLLEEIETKKVALTAMQEVSATSTTGKELDFTTLEKQVASLSEKISTEIAVLDELEMDQGAGSALSADEIMSTTSTANDTIEEMNRILGDK